MITTKEIQQPVTFLISSSPVDYLELSRLLAVAVVNPQFSRLLLETPDLALQSVYEGESFHFSDVERSLISSIYADTLADLAKQLIRTFGERPCIHCSALAPQPDLIEY